MLRRTGAVAIAACSLGLLAIPRGVSAQLPPTAEWAVHAQNRYQVTANVVYTSASGVDVRLDVYRRRDVATPQPTVVFYHGGGWIVGAKENSLMSLLPWLEMGWNVVNAGYRLARVAPAPGAVEDALCALRFVVNQAKTYNIDPNKVVVTGESAGGHLALMAGIVPSSAGLANVCAGGGFTASESGIPKVAAIINWYGIPDVTSMLSGPGARSYAVQWVGAANGETMGTLVSPLTYVRKGLPPVLSIHGDADPIVPYAQNVGLHEKLTKAGVPNELVTIPAGGHGNFKPEERTHAFVRIRAFLAKAGLPAER